MTATLIWLRMIKNDLASVRRLLTNHLRVSFACAAYVLHQALRTEVLAYTELATTQPATVILALFQIAVRVVQCKDRVKVHLPGQALVASNLRDPVQVPEPVSNSS